MFRWDIEGYSHAELVGTSPALVSAPGMNDLGSVMELCRLAEERLWAQKLESIGTLAGGIAGR